MGFPVSYYCPHCGAVVELECDGYLANKSVAPYPLEGWTYAGLSDDFEDAEGTRFVYGEDADENAGTSEGDSSLSWVDDVVDADDAEQSGLMLPCSRKFYPSLVGYEDDREIEAVPESDYVAIGGRAPSGPPGPRGPNTGPRGPDRPRASSAIRTLINATTTPLTSYEHTSARIQQLMCRLLTMVPVQFSLGLGDTLFFAPSVALAVVILMFADTVAYLEHRKKMVLVERGHYNEDDRDSRVWILGGGLFILAIGPENVIPALLSGGVAGDGVITVFVGLTAFAYYLHKRRAVGTTVV